MTMTLQPPKRKFGQTLTDLMTAFKDAPAGPIQQSVRRAFAGDNLLQNTEYELKSAKGALENLYQSAQNELFKVMGENIELEAKLCAKEIQYQTLDNNNPIVIHFDLEDVFNGYDLTASNQPRKAKKVSQFQQEVQQLQQEYEQLAQDLEAHKVHRTYLTLKTYLHGVTISEPKTDVDTFQDAVATFLEEDNKQQDAKYEKTRLGIARQRIITDHNKNSDTQRRYHVDSFIQDIRTKRDEREYAGVLELCHFVSALEPTNTHAHYFAATTYETLGNSAIKTKKLTKATQFYQQAQQEYKLAGAGSSATAGFERTAKLLQTA